jgi:hypothetical protein
LGIASLLISEFKQRELLRVFTYIKDSHHLIELIDAAEVALGLGKGLAMFFPERNVLQISGNRILLVALPSEPNDSVFFCVFTD